jgi:CheY-like chemotaxis protein
MTKLSDPVILVVDSDPVSVATTRTILDCQKYKVHSAQDFDSALVLAAGLNLDLVITDIRIGERNGTELIQEMRLIPGRSDVPVMFACASQAPGVIRRTHEFGAAFHLRKPFDPFVLLELVERALWMPHLVHHHLEQIKRPYFPFVSSPIPATTSVGISH